MSTAEIIAELRKLSPEELAQVQAKLKEIVGSAPLTATAQPIANHPALGTWKNRTDLPDDAIEASRFLRERMMRLTDTAES
jgi:hypothetical protein